VVWTNNERDSKWIPWLWILLAVLYIGLFFWLGLSTLRNGHGWLFFFGIFFPILWIFGAFARPAHEPAPTPRA
jgi:hypothetical protein